MGVEVQEHIHLHAEKLSLDVAQPLQCMEQGSQEQGGAAKGALLFATLQHWQRWAFAGVPLMLFGICWHVRKGRHNPERISKIWALAGLLVLLFQLWWFLRERKHMCDSSSKQESSPNKQGDTDREVEEVNDPDEK